MLSLIAKAHGIEYFAGEGNILSELIARGYTAKAFEILNDPFSQDTKCPKGFCNALHMALTVHPHSLTHWACVCSSWIWLCRSQTLRSAFYPLGDSSQGFVKDANTMVSKMVVIWLVLLMRQCLVLLEQPGSSVMDYHPRIMEMTRRSPHWASTRTWISKTI